MADETKRDDEKRRVEQRQIKEAVESSGVDEIGYASDVPSPMTEISDGASMQTYPSQGAGRAGVIEASERFSPQGYENMQPSILEHSEEQEAPMQDGQNYNYGAQEYGQAYAQYQPYQEVMSSDVITEISEQVVSEKLSNIQDKLEKAIDFKTAAESRISSLNERVARIEKIIDRLQLSILQKVGDYVNNVSDLKSELEETQKSFKALLPELKERGKHAPRERISSDRKVP